MFDNLRLFTLELKLFDRYFFVSAGQQKRGVPFQSHLRKRFPLWSWWFLGNSWCSSLHWPRKCCEWQKRPRRSGRIWQDRRWSDIVETAFGGHRRLGPRPFWCIADWSWMIFQVGWEVLQTVPSSTVSNGSCCYLLGDIYQHRSSVNPK